MKYAWIFLFSFFLMQCGSDPAPKNEAATPQAAKAAAPAPAKKAVEPEVATRPITQKAKNTTAAFTVSPASTTAQAGGKVCVPFEVSSFRDIMSMQYSMTWDSKLLKFEKVDGFNLPYMSRQNFGRHMTDKGVLTFLWLNNNLKGNTLTDGSKLYDVCFDVIGKSGQSASIAVTNKPTVIEALDAAEKLVQLKPGKGIVTIQ